MVEYVCFAISKATFNRNNEEAASPMLSLHTNMKVSVVTDDQRESTAEAECANVP